MKGKYHLLSGVVFLFLVFLFDLFYGLWLYSFFSEHVVFSFFALYLFFAGILLPDADKFGSFIFKFFFPFAIISWVIGFFVSLFKGKKFRHRGFLHSYFGIFLSSLVSALLVFYLFYLFVSIPSYFLFVFFISVLLGQIIHILFDYI